MSTTIPSSSTTEETSNIQPPPPATPSTPATPQSPPTSTYAPHPASPPKHPPKRPPPSKAAGTAATSRTAATTTTTVRPAARPMGRIIGDGGWYFHIVDMAVLPQHQRRGLGDAILKTLLAWIRREAPPGGDGDGEVGGTGAYVSLFADEAGRRLYTKNGFVESAPKELGMVMRLG